MKKPTPQQQTEIDCKNQLDAIFHDIDAELTECDWLEFGGIIENHHGIVSQYLRSWGGPSDGFWILEDERLIYWAQDWFTGAEITIDPGSEVSDWFHDVDQFHLSRVRIAEYREEYDIEKSEDERAKEALKAYTKILWLMDDLYDSAGLFSGFDAGAYFDRGAFLSSLIVLDEYITGKTSQYSRHNPQTQSQIDQLMNNELLDGLYLSDGGYSRLHITREEYTIDGDEQYQMTLVVTCSDPTEKIKRWCSIREANKNIWRRF